MFSLDDVQIRSLVFHRISLREDKLILSDSLCDYMNEFEAETLKKVFLKPFLNEFANYQFYHEYDITQNEVYQLTKNVFTEGAFLENTKNMASYLKSVSKHPNIKDGDIFVIHFDQLYFNAQFVEALGIYKIETQDEFIETEFKQNTSANLHFSKGISTRKLEKAALILFDEEPYSVRVIDNAKQGTEYWQEDFLKVVPVNNEFKQTTEFLTITKDYITNKLTEDFEINRADQIDLLNRSVQYFKSHEVLDKVEFEKEVFANNDVIESFREYDKEVRFERELEVPERFEISNQAVKKQNKIFKSVLKLDKNFHIYIHGKRELIEQGVEENGRKFYKIYYDHET